MNPNDAKTALGQLCSQASAVYQTAKTAQRNRKSLRGDNFYAHKFHDELAVMAGTLTKLRPMFARLNHDHARTACDAVTRAIETLKSLDADATTRMKAVKAIKLACAETLHPAVLVSTCCRRPW